ncbi:MAG: sugar porter family MFS transporter [Pirellulales bacterium]|nr:sugar porter family MFS transporter [Pirellulales bacterium]
MTKVQDAPDGGSIGYVYLLASVAALGGLLFGYDTAVISGAIGYLAERFSLNEHWTGWAAASALVGCIIGAAFAGVLSDRIGRKRVLLISAVLFTVSAIGTAVPRNLTEFAVARMLGGFGVGAASMLSPLYIAEVAPARIRGRLVSLNQLAIVFGMLAVYFVNAWIASLGDSSWNVAYGWRWMFGSETLPAVVFFVLLFGVPESPRWLTKQGRPAEAEAILSRVSGPRGAEIQMDEIRAAIAEESGSLAQLFQPGIRIALLIAVVLAILQQVTGINVVLYYAPEIFKSTGLAANQAINDTVIVGLVNMAFTLVAIWIVDRLGRKPLLLIASAGMGASLAALGGAFYLGSFQGPWVLLFTLAYVASFAVAMGPVVWVVLSEIFPTQIRGRAMSIATVSLWIACFLVSQTFPWMLKTLQGAKTFWIYAATCAVAFLFVLLFVPETKGKTLEEIERSWTR